MGVPAGLLGYVGLCTGYPGDSANCFGDCPWRSPSSVHHHRPNLGRCDVAGSGRHHCTINSKFGVPFALPHCAAPSRHQHVDAVNLAAPYQRPASPSSRRAALSSKSHHTAAECIPSPSLVDDLALALLLAVLRMNLHGAGHTFRQAYPT